MYTNCSGCRFLILIVRDLLRMPGLLERLPAEHMDIGANAETIGLK
jgi:hypothetical protein